MPKIILEKDKCISCGSCWAICEEYFEMSDDGKSHIKNANKADIEELEIDKLKCAEAAAEACPVQCILIKK